MPPRLTSFLVFLFLIVLSCLQPIKNAHAHECNYTSQAQEEHDHNDDLQKGVNMAEFWQKVPRINLGQNDIMNVKNIGFTFVRLPISEKWISKKNPEALEKLRCDIIGLLDAGLSVVVDLHPTGAEKKEMQKESSKELISRIETYWLTLSDILLDLPSNKIYISILNEPPRDIKNWWSIQGKIIKELRRTYPNHSLIATDNFSLYGTLTNKRPYNDTDIIYDFHFYTPMFFTHHNARWITPSPDPRERTDNVLYPAHLNINEDPSYQKMQTYIERDWNKEKLESLLVRYPIKWRNKTGARIVCLEFGVYNSSVDNESRLRWLADMSGLFDKYDIPWALWNYRGGYGIYSGRPSTLDHEMVKALGLSE